MDEGISRARSPEVADSARCAQSRGDAVRVTLGAVVEIVQHQLVARDGWPTHRVPSAPTCLRARPARRPSRLGSARARWARCWGTPPGRARRGGWQASVRACRLGLYDTYRGCGKDVRRSGEPRARHVQVFGCAHRAIKRARTPQPALQGAPNRRQRWSMPWCCWIWTYTRKGRAGSSSATSSSAVGAPRSRSSARKPYARKHRLAWW